MEVKKCPRCVEVKSISEFYRKKSLKSGISSWCKMCSRKAAREYGEKNKNKISEKLKINRISNAKKISESRRSRYAARKDIISAQQKEYYKKTKDKRCLYSAEYRKKFPIKARKAIKEWEGKNKDKVRVIYANANARRRALIGDQRLSSGISKRLIELQRGKCAICECRIKDGYHMDHIIPIVLGGSNTDDNIQLLCQPCNNKKHAKHPIDYMQSIGKLL